MKAKLKRRSNALTTDTGSFTETNALEHSQIRDKLCRFLKKVEGYEPAVDDIYIDQIVESIISSKKVGIFLKSETATEFTFSRVADAQVKFAKIINDASDQLSISRRDRLAGQDRSELMTELKHALLEALRNAESDQ